MKLKYKEDLPIQSKGYEDLLKKFLEKAETTANTQDLQEFVKFAQEIAEKEQTRYFLALKEQEDLASKIGKRQIGIVKEIATMLFGFVFASAGFYIFLNGNSEFGVFLIGAGFVALGISTGLIESFMQSFKK